MAQFINKDTLIREIEELDVESCISETKDGYYWAIDDVIELINNLEAKEIAD